MQVSDISNYLVHQTSIRGDVSHPSMACNNYALMVDDSDR